MAMADFDALSDFYEMFSDWVGGSGVYYKKLFAGAHSVSVPCPRVDYTLAFEAMLNEDSTKASQLLFKAIRGFISSPNDADWREYPIMGNLLPILNPKIDLQDPQQLGLAVTEAVQGRIKQQQKARAFAQKMQTSIRSDMLVGRILRTIITAPSTFSNATPNEQRIAVHTALAYADAYWMRKQKFPLFTDEAITSADCPVFKFADLKLQKLSTLDGRWDMAAIDDAISTSVINADIVRVCDDVLQAIIALQPSELLHLVQHDPAWACNSPPYGKLLDKGFIRRWFMKPREPINRLLPI